MKTAAVILGILALSWAYAWAARAQKTESQDKKTAGSPEAWIAPMEPFHIVGPIYYVGTKGLAVYLIKTSAGLILLNGAMPGSTPIIERSIRKLGYKPQDIKLLLISHAHFDHVGTLADLKELTGATVEVMGADVQLLRSGGKTDYLYGKNAKLHFAPVTADEVLKDGDVVTLGDVQMTARFTPGHTRGSMTWVMSVKDGAKSYTVVFPDGAGINPGTRLIKNPSYPGIEKDYARTFAVLESLHADIFLAYHAEAFDLEGKRKRGQKEGVKAWVDPEGYQKWVAERKTIFEQQVEAEIGKAAAE